MKTEYDERQELEILKGYRIGFWTLCALLLLVQMYKTIASTFGKDLLATTDFGVITFALIIISITVFCVHSVIIAAVGIKDAIDKKNTDDEEDDK